jgi:hypothetical protein
VRKRRYTTRETNPKFESRNPKQAGEPNKLKIRKLQNSDAETALVSHLGFLLI